MENIQRSKTPILTIKGNTRKALMKDSTTRAFNEFKFDARFFELFLKLLRDRIVVNNPNRRITVSADMYVEDDETFGSNETVRRQQTNSAILSAQGIAQTVMDFTVRMGGEIRVEFMVTTSPPI